MRCFSVRKKLWQVGLPLLLVLLVGGSVGFVWWKEQKTTRLEIGTLQNAADCTALLLKHGIVVKQPPLAVEQITLPQQTDAAYEAYLKLQEQQGIAARSFAGKEATLFLYEEEAESRWITLVICEGQLAAADYIETGRTPEAKPLF